MNSRAHLGPGERINPFVDPFRPVKWRRPGASTNPFAPPPYSWERGHYGFRSAYERARDIFETDGTIEARTDSEDTDPTLVAPDLFAAAVSAAIHCFREAIPPEDIPTTARAAALVAWHDMLRDLKERVRRP